MVQRDVHPHVASTTREPRGDAFRVETGRRIGGAYVKLTGELDIATADAAARALATVGELDGEDVALDLSELDFIDAYGLRLVFAARERLGDRLTVAADGIVRQLFELTGAGDLLAATRTACRPARAA